MRTTRPPETPARLMPPPRVTVLMGPTATGKTERALEWAHRSGAWILSADALQFYRGADLGTAKPSRAERAALPHYGIDVAEPDEPWDVRRYADYARAVVDAAARAGMPVLVVGGSGLYLSVFHAPPPDPVDIPPAVREEVAALAAAGGTRALRERLLSLDPDPPVDLCNPRRLAPALERVLATGLPVRELQRRHAERPCMFADCEREWFLLDRPNEELADRIERRTRAMLAGGLLAEVRALAARGLRANPTLASAIGYREGLEVLTGDRGEPTLATAINAATFRLVRRQRRWFARRMPDAVAL